MAPVAVGLGVTALLDELLQDEAKLNKDMDKFTGRDQKEQEEPAEVQQQLSKEDQEALNELGQEVDSCLASMGNWEEESRQRRLQLQKDLEKQYGFSCPLDDDAYPVMDAPRSLEEKNDSDYENEDLDEYLGGAARRQHGQRSALAPLPSTQDNVVATSVAKSKARERERQADAERVEKLRAEVESLRNREAHGMGPYDDMGTEDGNASMAGTAGLGLTGLSSWCREVDDLLADTSFGADGEGELARARDGLDEMDSALGAAHSRVNADIVEIEQLMAECNAMFQAPNNTFEDTAVEN